MDSQFVEGMARTMRMDFPRLVEVLGEESARLEVEGILGGLVLEMILDPTDAEEIKARVYGIR